MPISAFSPRLEDPSLDVMRRAIMQYLRDGNDPRVLPQVSESTVEQHDGLYYVVLRNKHGEMPLKVYRLFSDRSLKGLYKYPPAIKREYENTQVLANARRRANAS